MPRRNIMSRIRIAIPCGVTLLLSIAGFPAAAAEAPGRPRIARVPIEHSVAVEGDVAVVGAPWQNRFMGGATVFARDGRTWRVVQRLEPADLGRYDHFGASVFIDGDRIRVGAPWHDHFRGAVYVYRRAGNRWQLEQKVSSPEAMSVPMTASRSAAERTDDERAVEAAATATMGSPPQIRAAGGATVDWVSATDGAFEDRVEIKWAPVSLDAILYEVLRDGALIGIASSDDSLYNDDTGARGVTYNYCVVVMDMGGGEGPPVCDPGRRVIRAPERLSASDGQFIDGVHLTWEDRSSVESGYYVQRNGAPIATLDRNRRSFVDTTAVSPTAYTYEVIAFDSDGNLSNADADTGFRGVVLPPLDVIASDGEYAGSVRIHWTDAGGGVGFVVARSDLAAPDPVVLDTTVAGVTEFFDATAQGGVRYQYCVSTLDALGRLSVPACDEGGIDLAPPLSVAASDSTFDDRIQITWEDRSALASGYYIRRDGAPIDTVGAARRIYNDLHASPNAPHTYCVVAFSEHGGASASGCDVGFRMIVLAPTQVTATDGDFEDRTRITWESSSTTVAVFKILRDGVAIKSVGAGSRSYVDDGGTVGKEYVYGVQAVTAKLEASATPTDRGRRELHKPINAAATDDAFEDRVEISWRDVSAFETGFVIYRRAQGAAAADSIGETSTGTTSFVDRTGEPGATYHYSVAAFDTRGEARGESDPSDENDGVRTLLRPTAVDATDGTYEDRVEVTWQDHSNAEDGYRVYRDGVPIAATGDNVTSIFDLHPPFGVASLYSVRAFDRYGTSAADDDSGSTTLQAPTSFNASDTYAERIELRWVDVSAVEQGYILRTDSSDVTIRVDTFRAHTTSYTDLHAVPGVVYRYRLQAFAGSATSTVATDTGERPLPAAPVINRTPLLRLQANDAGQQTGTFGDGFGRFVSIGDEYLMLIGAYTDDDKGTFSGAAYVFQLGTNGTWSQEAKLYNEAPAASDFFGVAGGISGNWAAVGASGDDNSQGAMMFYERRVDGLWAATPKVFASPRSASSQFGAAVGIRGNRAIVGAPGYDNPVPAVPDRGRAFILERNDSGTWTQRAILAPGDSTVGSNSFGFSVAIDGDWAIVGSRFRHAAYVFHFNGTTWSQFARIDDPDPASVGTFGTSVGISGERAIVGRLTDKCFEQGTGAAYVFEYDKYANQWVQAARLVPSDSVGCGFGRTVSVSGDRAVVSTGAPGYGGHPDQDFGAYLFVREADGTWTQRERFGAGRTFEGEAISVSQGGVVLGSRAEETVPGVRSGAVYVSEMRNPGGVTASDGTFDGLVHVEWDDLARGEEGFIVYRDGVEYAHVDADGTFYDDTQAEPGRTYQYSVATINRFNSLLSERISDYGWRPPNGNITGRIIDRTGTGVGGVSVCLEPPPTRALLFDGRGGHVRIPDDGTFNFSATSNFTVEAWFKYSGSGGAPRLISKPPERGQQERPLDMGLQRTGGFGGTTPQRVFFTLSDGVNVAHVLARHGNMSDDRWHHVACVHDARSRQLVLYVDRVEEDRVSTAALGNLANGQDVFIGGYEAGTWFGGQLDELRIWSTARTPAELDATASVPLEGTETGLIGYWPFDEFSGALVTDYAGAPQYGVLTDGVYRTDQAAPLDFCGRTGSDGGFVLRNVRYAENGTEFKLRPSLGSRQFSPAVMPITLNRDHPVENQLVFSDVSSHIVSGAVRFAATRCYEQDVEIWVDNSQAAASDRNGKFSITLTEGLHTIRAHHRDYKYRVAFGRDTLAADSVTIDVRADVRDLVFLDQSTYPVSGKVGGGCGRHVGVVSVRFRSENNCIDTTFVGNPEYAIQLPPMQYFASATIDRETIPASLDRSDVITFFENLGERPVNLVASTDSTVIDNRLDFIYRAPLRVTVTGFEPYVSSVCPQLQLEDGTLLPAGLPVIPQGTYVDLAIRVDEAYGDSLCPLDTGRVVIADEIFDQENHPDTLTVSHGVVKYRTFASTPSLVRGRTEGRTDRSFQKSLVVRTVVEGRTPQTATEWVLVTGHVAPEGAEFVTLSTMPMPMLILRDPPGDGSSAYLEQRTSICSVLDWAESTARTALGGGLELKGGASSTFWVGVGAGTITKILGHLSLDNKITGGSTTTDQKKVTMCLTTSDRFTTSAGDNFIGEGGDVYVGAGLNFLFAEVGVLEVTGCSIQQTTSIGFEPDGINTTFAYAERHITDVLIPELASKEAYYRQRGDVDSATVFGHMREHWQDMVDGNRELKRNAVLKENRSFSAGADYQYTFAADTTHSHQVKTVGQFDLDTQNGVHAGIQDVFEADLTFIFKRSTETLKPAESTDSTVVNGSTVGYTLSDNDPGDNFTVNILEDGAYASPVFDVLGGRSSCPYEPWVDVKTGKASMVPRDQPQLLIDPHDRFGVAPDKPALFKLSIANLSNESRDYAVRLLSNSNPGGAIVRLNGSPISERPTFTVDGTGSNANVHEATLSVERGPSRFHYPDLRLVVEPVCGDAAVAETLSFSVAFEGCSDIHLSGPDVEPGWVYNRADSVAGKQLDLVLSGYELLVDPSVPNVVKAVGIQYRSMGDGRDGPGPWTDIRETLPGIVADASIDGSPDTILVWRPDSLANGGYQPLADGIYEVRAYSVCSAGGRGYSNASSGTIDRHAPLVFGTPHPSDGELSLGEDVGVTFNEPLDCDGLANATIGLRYVDGPQAGQAIPVTVTCDGTTIIIVPKADGAALDGRKLEASVAGVRDRAGNAMTSAVTWRFDYRKSLFTWSETRISQQVALVTPGTVSAKIVNGTGQAVDYEVTSMPAFLSVTSAQSRGRLAPGGVRTIEFDIDPAIAGGIHEGQVGVRATAGTEPVAVATLNVVLDVSCAAPQWAIDPSRFEHSMSIVGRVQVGAGRLTGANDRIAAFVGDQIRGVTRPRAVAGDTLVFLTVFSNRTTGELVRFEVWDDDQCRHYRSTAERAPFDADAVLGTTITPLVLTAQDAPPGSVASFPLAAGWNWFSTNVISTDMSPGAIFASLAPAAGDIVKSKTSFAVFDPDTAIGWVGTLTTLDNTSGYMVRLTEGGTVLQEGVLADPGATPVPIANGWNWIGYVPATAMSVGTALADLVTRGFLDGDEIAKGQGAFAEWNSGWFGTLENLEPGKGYRLHLQDPALPSTFDYPSGAPATPAFVASATDAVRAQAPVGNATGWQLDPGSFEYNMTLIAQVKGEGRDWDGTENLLGAFVGDECRGIVPLMRVPRLGRCLAFVTIHGNRPEGETIRFRAYHAASRAISDVAETVAFRADVPAGTIREPIVLTAASPHGALPTVFRLAPTHPNPFQNTTTIRFELPEARHVSLKIYNVAGQEVCTLAEADYPAGAYDVPWNTRTSNGDLAPNGVYFYKIRAGRFVDAKKMVLVR